MVNVMNILFAPAHYKINDISEMGWPYYIIKNISQNQNMKLFVIANFIEKKIISNNVKIYQLGKNDKRNNFKTLYFYFKCFLKSKYILKNNDIDIIHHMLPFGYEQTFNLIPLFNLNKEKPFIIGPLQNPQMFEAPGLNDRIIILSKPILKKLFEKTVKKSSKLIVVNNFTKKLYMKYAPEERIEIIQPGINIDEFKYVKKKDSNIEILFSGFLIRRKGVIYLIKAFKEISKNYKNISLKIVGDGPEKRNLESISNKSNLKNKIKFEGWVDHENLYKYYQNCDIFVLPSLSESFGQVLIEAMACGKPCIASNITGPNEIVLHNKTGYLFEPKNVTELTKYISILIEDEKLRIKLGKNARKIVEEKYDWKKITEKYCKIYEEVIK